MSTEMEDFLTKAGVTRVVHFSPAKNLDGIFSDGMIRDAVQLSADAQPHYTVTDEARIDRQPNLICASFEYPNVYYQRRAMQKPQFVNYPGWVCFLIQPEVVLREGTLFHPCNAATGSGVYGLEGLEGMTRMWASPSIPGARVRQATHLGSVPTDLQAEIQIPGPILLSEVQAIVAPTPGRARELYGHLDDMGLKPERVEWRSAPLFFDATGLARAIQQGLEVPETVWGPTPEDVA